VKVTRTYGDQNNRRVEFFFKLEDFAIRVREQAKSFVKAIEAFVPSRVSLLRTPSRTRRC
jgi:hypothetical protein